MPEELLPGVTPVVHTAKPYHHRDIKLDAARPPTFRDRPLYHFKVAGLSNGLLWCPNDRVQVVQG